VTSTGGRRNSTLRKRGETDVVPGGGGFNDSGEKGGGGITTRPRREEGNWEMRFSLVRKGSALLRKRGESLTT